MRKFVIPLLAIGLLAGCSEGSREEVKPQVVSRLKSVEVINKKEEGHYRASSDYYLTVKKNGNTATFEVSEDIFKMVNEKSVISANQLSNGELTNVVFPSLK